jgi:hypothetical protein
MPPTWYLDWVKNYLVTNGANDATNQQMLISWFNAFDALRATPQEMVKATVDVLALTNRPIRMGDHFAALRVAIVTRRADAAARAIADYSAEDRGACVECGNTGSVIVPHPSHANAERWNPVYTVAKTEFYPTAGVVCRCEAGRRIVACQQNVEGRPKQMTLDHYEQYANGNWREQIDEQRQRNKAIRDTEVAIDPNAILKTLASQFAVGRKK